MSLLGGQAAVVTDQSRRALLAAGQSSGGRLHAAEPACNSSQQHHPINVKQQAFSRSQQWSPTCRDAGRCGPAWRRCSGRR